MLITEFLNLVTGSHKKTDLFWREDVTTGVCQRCVRPFDFLSLKFPYIKDLKSIFGSVENKCVGIMQAICCLRFGTVALTTRERAGLWDVCSERPELLYMIVKELIEVTGIR